MSLPTLLAMAAAGGGRGVVTLTDASITDSGPSPARAIVLIRSDGTVDKREGLTVSQINASTDWIIPNGKADSNYEVKWDLVSGDAPTDVTGGWTEGTWASLSVGKQVGYTTDAPGNEAGVIRISIRYNGGSVLDTGDFTCSATEV